MFRRPTLRALLVATVAVAAAPGQTLIWPGEKLATIDAEHLRAYVPFAQAEDLRELVARANQIYGIMQQDAGFEPRNKLRLLVSDWVDGHNGFSFVTPFPLVQVELAPSLPESAIFNGANETELTLIHEFAHQISNDRNHGFRDVLERIFGRVLPFDFLTLALWYASTPAHQTMPRFWHEGLATWAETAYADPTHAFAGRGRDPLVHMVWRLDAAANDVPRVSDWRITWHEWPFGDRVYLYGTAYLRWLDAAMVDRASVWRIIDEQSRAWPFLFDRTARRTVGSSHIQLIRGARAALTLEQQGALATLRSAPVTAPERLTPKEMVLRAPAFLPDGSLVFAAKPAQGRARLHTLSPDGELSSSWTGTLSLSPMRSVPGADGVVYHEYNWRQISRVELLGSSYGWRWLQPDVGPDGPDGRRLVGIRLLGAGKQELFAARVRDGEVMGDAALETEGRPWNPALRPEHDGELVWVETNALGSKLVLASISSPEQRRVLTEVKGRILHPVWSRDGAHVYYCADHTGVANAYRLSVGGDGAVTVVPVTNTIGGVIACVPSPDGKTLAIVDHDADGPFVAKMSADPRDWVQAVPAIALAWPAPIERRSGAALAEQAVTTIPPLAPGVAEALSIEPYNGLAELRPLFWAPTTFAVPEGGYGIYGIAADPIFSHVVQGGVGVGLAEQEPVGFFRWDYLGWPIEIGLGAGRSERSFNEVILDTNGTLYDYTETVAYGELRAGRGLFALQRTWLLHGAIGIEDHDAVDSVRREYQGQTLVSTNAFTATERYAEFTFGYADSTFYPTSYTREDGISALASYRRSGFGGELERNSALTDASYTWSIFPQQGHQVVVRGQAGWSDGDDTLQGSFSVGGGLARGFPRGYTDEAVASGRHLAAGSFAYRFPVGRPFEGAWTAPFRSRQLVVELFGDTAKVSSDHIGGNGKWFTSVGAELHANFEFFDGSLSPGIGIAAQLDGERDVEAYFTLGFVF